MQRRQQGLVSDIKGLARDIEGCAKRLRTQPQPKPGTVHRLWADVVLLRDMYERLREQLDFMSPEERSA